MKYKLLGGVVVAAVVTGAVGTSILSSSQPIPNDPIAFKDGDRKTKEEIIARYNHLLENLKAAEANASDIDYMNKPFASQTIQALDELQGNIWRLPTVQGPEPAFVYANADKAFSDQFRKLNERVKVVVVRSAYAGVYNRNEPTEFKNAESEINHVHSTAEKLDDTLRMLRSDLKDVRVSQKDGETNEVIAAALEKSLRQEQERLAKLFAREVPAALTMHEVDYYAHCVENYLKKCGRDYRTLFAEEMSPKAAEDEFWKTVNARRTRIADVLDRATLLHANTR